VIDRHTLRHIESEVRGRLERLQRMLLSPSTPRGQVDFIRGGAHHLEQLLAYLDQLSDRQSG